MASQKHALSGSAAGELQAAATPTEQVFVPGTEQMDVHSESLKVEFVETKSQLVYADPSLRTKTNDVGTNVILRLLATVFGGCMMLAFVFGDGASVKWSIAAMSVGLGAATWLVYDAQTRKRNVISQMLLYFAGFVLLAEVILFINRLIAHGLTKYPQS